MYARPRLFCKGRLEMENNRCAHAAHEGQYKRTRTRATQQPCGPRSTVTSCDEWRTVPVGLRGPASSTHHSATRMPRRAPCGKVCGEGRSHKPAKGRGALPCGPRSTVTSCDEWRTVPVGLRGPASSTHHSATKMPSRAPLFFSLILQQSQAPLSGPSWNVGTPQALWSQSS